MTEKIERVLVPLPVSSKATNRVACEDIGKGNEILDKLAFGLGNRKGVWIANYKFLTVFSSLHKTNSESKSNKKQINNPE